MAAPLSAAVNTLAMASFTFKACLSLHSGVRGLRSQNKDIRNLKAELNRLTVTLKSLLDTVTDNPTVDLKALKLPLQDCGHSCEEYGTIVKQLTQLPSEGSGRSLCTRAEQEYLLEDINDFRDRLAGWNSTFQIALADANLRLIKVSPKVLEDYKDTISDTMNDLQIQLCSIQDKIDRIQTKDSLAFNHIPRQTTILKEKESTQIGLDMCAQISAQLSEFEATTTKDTPLLEQLSVCKQVEPGLDDVKGSIKSLETRLKTHEIFLNSQIGTMVTMDTSPEQVAAKLAKLQRAARCTSQCIDIVDAARELVGVPNGNFESTTLADCSFSVLTINDLVRPSRLSTAGRMRYLGGQMPNETMQTFFKSSKPLDTELQKSMWQTRRDEAQNLVGSGPTSSSSVRELRARYGSGLPFSSQYFTGSLWRSQRSDSS